MCAQTVQVQPRGCPRMTQCVIGELGNKTRGGGTTVVWIVWIASLSHRAHSASSWVLTDKLSAQRSASILWIHHWMCCSRTSNPELTMPHKCRCRTRGAWLKIPTRPIYTSQLRALIDAVFKIATVLYLRTGCLRQGCTRAHTFHVVFFG